MIRKLKIRFIMVTMISVLLVLSLIMGTINVLNYRNITESADQILEILKENGGSFPSPANELNPLENFEPEKEGRHPEHLSAETPYESRYFSVIFSSDGQAAGINTQRIAAVDQQQAEEVGKTVYSSGKTTGFIKDYRYLSYTNDSEQTVILFLDCGRSLGNFHSFLLTSVVISLIGTAAVFLLVLLLSSRAIRPVQESYQKQKRFITDAGHELRTPLTIIDADVSVLEMDIGQNEWLTDVRLQTKRLAALTNDLVYLSRMDEGNSQLQRIDFPISDLVSETAGSYRSRAQMDHKVLSADITPLLSYCGDEKAISKAVNILLDNALKYSSPEGNIHVSLKRSGKGVVLEVTNSVDSISSELLSHMFDRFYRGDASRNSKKGGYGIGLSIVEAVALAHHGKASATAPDPHTLRITVVLA